MALQVSLPGCRAGSASLVIELDTNLIQSVALRVAAAAPGAPPPPPPACCRCTGVATSFSIGASGR